jgi:hypothetical protein
MVEGSFSQWWITVKFCEAPFMFWDLLERHTNSCFLLSSFSSSLSSPSFFYIFLLLFLFFSLACQKRNGGGVTLDSLCSTNLAIHRSLKGDIYALSQSHSHTHIVRVILDLWNLLNNKKRKIKHFSSSSSSYPVLSPFGPAAADGADGRGDSRSCFTILLQSGQLVLFFIFFAWIPEMLSSISVWVCYAIRPTRGKTSRWGSSAKEEKWIISFLWRLVGRPPFFLIFYLILFCSWLLNFEV